MLSNTRKPIKTALARQFSPVVPTNEQIHKFRFCVYTPLRMLTGFDHTAENTVHVQYWRKLPSQGGLYALACVGQNKDTAMGAMLNPQPKQLSDLLQLLH